MSAAVVEPKCLLFSTTLTQIIYPHAHHFSVLSSNNYRFKYNMEQQTQSNNPGSPSSVPPQQETDEQFFERIKEGGKRLERLQERFQRKATASGSGAPSEQSVVKKHPGFEWTLSEVKALREKLQRVEEERDRVSRQLHSVEAERDRAHRTAEYVIHQANDLGRRLKETETLYQGASRYIEGLCNAGSQQGHTTARRVVSAPAGPGAWPTVHSTMPRTEPQKERDSRQLKPVEFESESKRSFHTAMEDSEKNGNTMD